MENRVGNMTPTSCACLSANTVELVQKQRKLFLSVEVVRTLEPPSVSKVSITVSGREPSRQDRERTRKGDGLNDVE